MTGILAAAMMGMAGMMDAVGREPQRTTSLKKPGVRVLKSSASREVAEWNARVDAKKAERKARRLAARGRA